MTLVAVPGTGFWLPPIPNYVGNLPFRSVRDTTLDAHDEELQIIYTLTMDGGGTKTFGTAGSSLGWHTGGSTIFGAGSTLRVGVKDSSKIGLTTSPPIATPGAAAFSVYRDLVGGTDALASSAWQTTPMATGTPFSVSDGDTIAVCFHLSVSSGSPAIRLQHTQVALAGLYPTMILLTAGPTSTVEASVPNVMLTCDDGTLAWGEVSSLFDTLEDFGAPQGQNNSQGNIVRVPFPCKVDAVMALIYAGSVTAHFAFEVYGTPLTTPTVLATTTHDAHLVGFVASGRSVVQRFAVPPTLSANVDYVVGLKQLTSTFAILSQYSVAAPGHFKPNGLDGSCYAAQSVGGAAFSALNAGKNRFLIWPRISHVEDGSGTGGGGMHLVGAGGLAG